MVNTIRMVGFLSLFAQIIKLFYLEWCVTFVEMLILLKKTRISRL